MEREIIEIDEALCTGCGDCVPGCHEGALQIIDGKARLVSDLMCDGLGACVGHCPTGAMTVVRREAEAYDERRVMEQNIIPSGGNTIRAHLEHLLDHGETEYHRIALQVLAEQGVPVPAATPAAETKAPAAESAGCGSGGGCPGSLARILAEGPGTDSRSGGEAAASGAAPGRLRQWPVQLHLLNPEAPYFRDADVMLAADCTAYAVGDFHERFLNGRTLAIACPKLDSNLENYVDKLRAMIDRSAIDTLTVLMMNVPCCSGLLALAQRAAGSAARSVPVKKIIVSPEGEVLESRWI